MASDQLYLIFERHLLVEINTDQTVEELIYEVVSDYIFELFKLGTVPPHVQDQLEEDLKEEVMEMYRKKTYGFLSLQDFRKVQGAKSGSSVN